MARPAVMNREDQVSVKPSQGTAAPSRTRGTGAVRGVFPVVFVKRPGQGRLRHGCRGIRAWVVTHIHRLSASDPIILAPQVFGCVRAVFGRVAGSDVKSRINTCKTQSRRADSNRGPLRYESRPKRAASPLQSLQALSESQISGLRRTAGSPKEPSGVRLVFGPAYRNQSDAIRREDSRAGMRL